VLLVGAAGSPWIDAAGSMKSEFEGLPLEAYCVGRDLIDRGDGFAAAYGISSSGATLLRPDSFVAWNCPNVVAEPATALRAALNRSLSTRQ
jgi:putative polyketide hydroxylase